MTRRRESHPGNDGLDKMSGCNAYGLVRPYEVITGCNTKKRDGFNSMVADALAGRIVLIVTKSVSRFARNTAYLNPQAE